MPFLFILSTTCYIPNSSSFRLLNFVVGHKTVYFYVSGSLECQNSVFILVYRSCSSGDVGGIISILHNKFLIEDISNEN